MERRKCAVIGCGSVGSTIAYTLMNSSLFNSIVLIDTNEAKAKGEALDIAQGSPFCDSVDVVAGDYSDISDAMLVIITAGANQLPGETRLDLISKNTSIFKEIIPSIIKYNKKAILLVVANPVDVLTTVALKLSGFPRNRVFGSGTVLDTARLKYLLSEYMEVDSRNIHTFIVGEHGDSELALWSRTFVSGLPINDYCQQMKIDLDKDKIYKTVRNSAYEIISRKGVTNYAIAMAVKRICQSIVHDENSIMPVSVYATGEYGINDICIGLPTKVGRNGVGETLLLPLSKNELCSIQDSAKTLKDNFAKIDL